MWPITALITALTACALIPAAALNNGLASKPGLGWNSDYCTACVHLDAFGRLKPGYTGFQNEAFIRHIADYVNASGLQALGYHNINMDSLWNLPTRSPSGDLQPDPALWPSGFDAIVAYVHSRGLDQLFTFFTRSLFKHYSALGVSALQLLWILWKAAG